MTFRSRLSIASYFLSKSIIRLILNVVVLSFLFIGIGVLIVMMDSFNSLNGMIESVIKRPIEKCGVMYVDYSNCDKEEIEEFIKALSSEDYVYAFGDIMAGSFDDYIPYLRERQREYSDFVRKEDDFLNGGLVYYTNMNCCSLMGVELYDGQIVDQSYIEELNSQGNVGVYLGYAYRDIPVGTEINTEDNKKCIVLGVLKKGSKWLGQNTFHSDLIYNLNILVDLDYAFLIVEPIIPASPMIIAFNDQVSFDEGEQKVSSLAAEFGINVYCKSFSRIVFEAEMTERNERLLLLFIDILMLIIFIIATAKFQINTIMKRKKEYGVLISSGATMKDIKTCLILEAFIKWFIAGVISFTIVYFYAYYRYGMLNTNYYRVINYIIIHHSLGKYIGISAITSFLATYSPYKKLGNMTLIDFFD